MADHLSLIDVLIVEQIQKIFLDAMLNRDGVEITFLYGGESDFDPSPLDEHPSVRLATPDGRSLLVSPRRMAWEIGDTFTEIVGFDRLIGYDWIALDMSEKISQKAEHYDRLLLHVRGDRTQVIEKLGPAVYPLMTLLANVLQLMSEKVLLRKMDEGVVDLLGRALRAVAEGPFFPDNEMKDRFGRDRGSLQVLAHLWPGLNLASPELERTLSRAVRNLVDIRPSDPDLWDEWVGGNPEQLAGALEVFRSVTGAFTG